MVLRDTAWIWFYLVVLLLLQSCYHQCPTQAASLMGGLMGGKEQKNNPKVIPIKEEMLQENLDLWLKDYAVMFYSDWCPHCKKFAPVWEQIAADVVTPRGRKGKEDIVVGKFNCEQNNDAIRFCVKIGVTHYPTFMVFGYGNFFNRGLLAGVFNNGKDAQLNKIVKYNGLIYYEALRDWVKTMQGISKMYRTEDKVKGWLGIKRAKDPMPMLLELKKENKILREQNEYLTEVASEASMYGGYQSETAIGDPFYELAAVDYDEKYVPVVACVVDLLKKYCPKAKNEPYCALLDDCIHKEFAPNACRPDKCPLKDEGCELVAACLEDDILQVYIDLYSDSEDEEDDDDDEEEKEKKKKEKKEEEKEQEKKKDGKETASKTAEAAEKK